MGSLTEPLRRVFLGQGRVCAAMGSPFSGGVLTLLAGPLESAAGPFLGAWGEADLPKLVADAVPLRLLGALHWLVLSGAEPALADLYPPRAPVADSDALAAVLPEVFARRRTEIARFLESPPQTNEVRRCLALIGGFLTLAREVRLPMRCLEIGASAGLNQSWFRYGYSFGEGVVWGSPAAPVQLDGDWRGPPPPLADVGAPETAACDIAPIDVRDPGEALRLQAYVWPDQTDRLERLRAAIGIAVDEGVRVERADAVAWVAERFTPAPGRLTVLFHSVMWQYMPPDTQGAVRDSIARAGTEATAQAPVAWLRMEPPTTAHPDMEVRLTLWPTGEERLLARAHPHGAWVEWLAG